MLKFISFGSGSSGNCYCLLTENDGLIIDSGIGIRTLKKYCANYQINIRENIHNILITHDHADHIKSVGLLSKEFALPVHATSDVHQGINRNYSVHEKVATSMVRIIEKNARIRIGEFFVTPFAVPHDSSGNVGYKIEYGDTVFCLMTDVGHVTDEMKSFISQSDYLVLEANYDEFKLATGNYPQYLKERISGPEGHLSNKMCGEALANNATERLKRVWLCHLSEENNHPIIALKTVEEVLRSYGIILGKEFLVEVLKRRSPSGIYELV